MLNREQDPQYPARNVTWTDDFKVELPIRKAQEGVGALEATTLIDEFRQTVREYGGKPALSVKRNNQWVLILTNSANPHFQRILQRMHEFCRQFDSLQVPRIHLNQHHRI